MFLATANAQALSTRQNTTKQNQTKQNSYFCVQEAELELEGQEDAVAVLAARFCQAVADLTVMGLVRQAAGRKGSGACLYRAAYPTQRVG
jgi:hypothetical protein